MGFVITLIVVGLLLVIAEIILVPGVGVAGILGLISMIGSCVYAFYVMGTVAGTVVTAVNVVFLVALTWYVLREKTWTRFTLNTSIESKVSDADATLAVGDRGRTVTRLSPVGSARFNGRVYEVKALEGMIDNGKDIEVALIEDNKIIVKLVESDF